MTILIAPPDTDGSVGPNHLVQMINLLTTIYEKCAAVVQASFPSNAFWSGIVGNCEPLDQGDPIVLYDEFADRWLVSQFAFPDNLNSFSQSAAISQAGDPTGGYNCYEFSVGDGGGGNNPPVASFTTSCTDLTCTFTDTSTDSDGNVVAWDWDFGDTNTSTAQNSTHTYAAGGTYTVTLTVTDNDSTTGTDEQNVTLTEPPTGGITLSATGYKVRGLQKSDLGWDGATSSNVYIYRDGTVIQTTANDGLYTVNINNRGGGSYTYEVCEASSAWCFALLTTRPLSIESPYERVSGWEKCSTLLCKIKESEPYSSTTWSNTRPTWRDLTASDR
jgi:hypothetical protein